VNSRRLCCRGRWLPFWIKEIETDLAARYVVSDTAQETNLRTAGGLKIDSPEIFIPWHRCDVEPAALSFFESQSFRPSGDVGSGEVTRISITDPRLGAKRTPSKRATRSTPIYVLNLP